MSTSASRRSFFKQTAVLSAAGLVLPACESTPPKQAQIPDHLGYYFKEIRSPMQTGIDQVFNPMIF